MGHALILFGVLCIVQACFKHVDTGPSLKYAYIVEGVIVAFAIISNLSTRQIVSALDKGVLNLDSSEEWMDKNPRLKGRVQAGILLLIFALQFGSMAALLVATGGPIDSPFAPMALAIGVFTPFIVNKWGTVALVIFTTVIFYVLIIMIVGFSGEGSRPQPSAYAAVNIFILVLASFMTFKRRKSLSFTLRKMVKASPERVWRAWTQDSQVASWLGSDGDSHPEIQMDVSPGGGWQVTTTDREGRSGVPWSGVYREVEPPKRLVFTVDARSGVGEEIVTVVLKKRGDHVTEMLVTQADNGRLDGLKEGWSWFLDRIALDLAVAARNDARRRGGSDD
jgi:uncharacterized protein YndB with AHSA1/START domain